MHQYFRVACKLDLPARDGCSFGTSVQRQLPLVISGRGGSVRYIAVFPTRFSEQQRRICLLEGQEPYRRGLEYAIAGR